MINQHQDIFPATIVITTPEDTTPPGELRSAPPTAGAWQIHTARVIIARGRILIATDGNDGPQLVFSQDIIPETHYKSPDFQVDSYVTAVSGQKIAFRKDSGCGCGSRLKSWNPYRFITSIEDPTA